MPGINCMLSVQLHGNASIFWPYKLDEFASDSHRLELILRSENKQNTKGLVKDHNFERSRSMVKMKGTIEFLDHENIATGIKIIMLRGLVQTLPSKAYFFTKWLPIGIHLTFKPLKIV